MNYTPLWIKTDYSLLSSLIKIDDLVIRLKELNITSVAICDDNLFGAMEFYNKCKRNNIKPIIGLEINLNFKILLYAKNYFGYQNLCVIDTLKNKNELDINKLKDYLSNIVIIVPFEYKDKVEILKDYDIYIGYDENDNIKGIDKKVYVKKTLVFSKEDEKYLKYLYKIKEEEYNDLKSVYLNDKLNHEDSKTTNIISELCNVEILKNNKLLPKYSSDAAFNANEYLKDLCIFGLKKRLNGNVNNLYAKRLKSELEVITEMGFCNYFLIVWDYVKFAKKNNILVGPGRGSAASSLVSYSLGITDIDPLKYNLLFERFLNPSRVTMPDIDIDFDALKRDKVINYVIDKYGKEKVCGIVTFSNLLAKQVIRDISKIFNISNYKVDNLIKCFDDNKTLKEQLNIGEVVNVLSKDEELKKVYDIAMHLEGVKRHLSQHAAGIIIASEKLCNYVPLTINPDGTYLCGYTKDYIEDIGLLKMDFLGLKNLSMVDKILYRIKNNIFNNIPLDDKKTFDLFVNGNVDGIFQFETPGMKKFIEKLKPRSINDLIIAVALFRPGPMDNIDHFIKRRDKKEQIHYINNDLKEILEETNGIIIYQEQIMLIANKIAKFSLKEADDLRYAMSKKKENLIIAYKEKFINGCISNGYSIKDSKDIYDMILKFASYGFNKAHSVSYGILGYKIAYLKANYTGYFICEILNNYVGVQSKTRSLIIEAKRLGLKIAKPSINNVTLNYELNNDEILFPLSMIKNIGTLTAREILEERMKGDFETYIDFVKRCYKKGHDVLRSIILSGLLDCFNYNKKTMIENMEDVINYAELINDLDDEFVLKPEIKLFEEYSNAELMNNEIELFGFYISNHPTSKYIYDDSITTKTINNYFDKKIEMVLYFEKRKDINTKKNDRMMFIEASDVYGNIELVCFPNEYKKVFNIVVPGLYKVYGKVEKRFSSMQIIINDIKKI